MTDKLETLWTVLGWLMLAAVVVTFFGGIIALLCAIVRFGVQS